MSYFCFFVSFVSLGFFLSPAQAELVYTADGRTIYGQMRAGAAAGTLVVDGGDGAPVTLQREEVSSIEFRPPTAGSRRPSAPTVALRNGDRLKGPLRQLWPRSHRDFVPLDSEDRVMRSGCAVRRILCPGWFG